MRPMPGIALLLAFACAVIAVLVWRGGSRGTTPQGARTADAAAPEGANARAARPAHVDDAAPSVADARAQGATTLITRARFCPATQPRARLTCHANPTHELTIAPAAAMASSTRRPAY